MKPIFKIYNIKLIESVQRYAPKLINGYKTYSCDETLIN